MGVCQTPTEAVCIKKNSYFPISNCNLGSLKNVMGLKTERSPFT